MKRKWLLLITVLLCVCSAAYLSRNVILQISVEKRIRKMTSMKVNVLDAKVDLFKTRMRFEDVIIYNPDGFRDRIMADIPEIFVDYDVPNILKGKIALHTLRVYLEQLNVIKNAEGELNLDRLKVFGIKLPKNGQSGEVPPKPREVYIKKLELKGGKVTFRDYSKGGSPLVEEFEVNIDGQYENVTDPDELVSLIVLKALRKTPLVNLSELNLKKLQYLTSRVISSAQKAVGTAATKVYKSILPVNGKPAEPPVTEPPGDVPATGLPEGPAEEIK